MFEQMIAEEVALGAAMQFWGGIGFCAAIVLVAIARIDGGKCEALAVACAVLAVILGSAGLILFGGGTYRKHTPIASIRGRLISVSEAAQTDYAKLFRDYEEGK